MPLCSRPWFTDRTHNQISLYIDGSEGASAILDSFLNTLHPESAIQGVCTSIANVTAGYTHSWCINIGRWPIRLARNYHSKKLHSYSVLIFPNVWATHQPPPPHCGVSDGVFYSTDWLALEIILHNLSLINNVILIRTTIQSKKYETNRKSVCLSLKIVRS